MVLAPQLRQSLQMLQLPVLELRSLIREELEKNPTLEEVPTESPTIEIEPTDAKENPDEKKELDFAEDFAVLARLDEEWRDYFFQERAARPFTADDNQKRQFFLDSLPHKESLQQHLMTQLALAGLSEPDCQIGELIVGSINDDGYLASHLDELAQTAGLDAEHMADILTVIQEFDPTGVGARDLKECLQLQLRRLGKTASPAYDIVTNHIEKLASRKLQDIARTMKISMDEVREAAEFIGTLDPKPGHAHSSERATYILPEVLVQKVQGEYAVIIDDDQLPRVRISKHYRALMRKKATSAEVKDYIMQSVRSGVFLIKSIQQRQQTLFKIATEIVKIQSAFLDNGLAHLRPLTMSKVADAVGVHETTVSRAVAGKYMRTPRGLFEMKYFFTPGIKTSDGKDLSNETVKNMIAQLVAKELSSQPLTDHELVEKLDAQGVHIARRTVAKYRLVLRIPPSHMRRSR